MDRGFTCQMQMPVTTTGCDQRAIKVFERADSDTFSIKGSSLAAAGNKLFLTDRVYHDGMFDLTLMQASDRDAEMG